MVTNNKHLVQKIAHQIKKNREVWLLSRTEWTKKTYGSIGNSFIDQNIMDNLDVKASQI